MILCFQFTQSLDTATLNPQPGLCGGLISCLWSLCLLKDSSSSTNNNLDLGEPKACVPYLCCCPSIWSSSSSFYLHSTIDPSIVILYSFFYCRLLSFSSNLIFYFTLLPPPPLTACPNSAQTTIWSLAPSQKQTHAPLQITTHVPALYFATPPLDSVSRIRCCVWFCLWRHPTDTAHEGRRQTLPR